MELLNQAVKLYKQPNFQLNGIFKAVEYAGRCCYNSYDKITDSSYLHFIKMLRKSKHYSPFAFGTVHLKIHFNKLPDAMEFKNEATHKMVHNASIDEFFCIAGWSDVFSIENNWYITTNARIMEEWIVYLGKEKFSLWDLLSECITDEEQDKFEDRPFVKCTTSIAMTRELNRHSTSLAICEKSTRYVKVEEVIKPYWYDNTEKCNKVVFDRAMENAINDYNLLLTFDMQKQQARDVLPLATSTDVCYCGLMSDWNWVVKQRSANNVHPQMKELINLIKDVIYFE